MSEVLWKPGQPPLVAWYGDDFTGTAAVLEVLAFAGLPAVVFLDVPTDKQRARFGDMAAIGLAGTARAESPAWMKHKLPAVWDWLDQTNAQLLSYKICSTLDSSPYIGSIGCACDTAVAKFGMNPIPCVVAAPGMGRYQAFGTLFATGPDGNTHRLDRHPVMLRHPITPMTEADVARHLSEQTKLPVNTIELNQLAAIERLSKGAAIHCFDNSSKTDGREVGRILWDNRDTARFTIGSQGLQMALLEHWRDTGMLAPASKGPTVSPRQAVAVSGSVSATTAGQIDYALAHGFEAIAIEASQIIESQDACNQVVSMAVQQAIEIIDRGAMPLLYTARGPDDPAVHEFRAAVGRSSHSQSEATTLLGEAIGGILFQALEATGVRRALIAGGDTSGRIMKALGGIAITASAAGTVGSSIFRLASDGPMDGLEVALKGGQMGNPDVFVALSTGSNSGMCQQGSDQ